MANVDKTSEIYLLQEVQDEKYELLFGDGILGKKLSSGDVIKVSYITTDGSDGNGPSLFSYAGTTTNSDGSIKNSSLPVNIATASGSSGGGDIETIESVKYFF